MARAAGSLAAQAGCTSARGSEARSSCRAHGRLASGARPRGTATRSRKPASGTERPRVTETVPLKARALTADDQEGEDPLRPVLCHVGPGARAVRNRPRADQGAQQDLRVAGQGGWFQDQGPPSPSPLLQGNRREGETQRHVRVPARPIGCLGVHREVSHSGCTPRESKAPGGVNTQSPCGPPGPSLRADETDARTRSRGWGCALPCLLDGREENDQLDAQELALAVEALEAVIEPDCGRRSVIGGRW